MQSSLRRYSCAFQRNAPGPRQHVAVNSLGVLLNGLAWRERLCELGSSRRGPGLEGCPFSPRSVPPYLLPPSLRLPIAPPRRHLATQRGFRRTRRAVVCLQAHLRRRRATREAPSSSVCVGGWIGTGKRSGGQGDARIGRKGSTIGREAVKSEGETHANMYNSRMERRERQREQIQEGH